MARYTLIAVIVLLVLLAGCVKTETLGDKKDVNQSKQAQSNATEADSNLSKQQSPVSSDVNLTDSVVSAANITIESEENDSAAPAAPSKPKNRIDAKTGSTSSQVTAVWEGKTETFSVPDVDKDAVAFDIAAHLGRGIREVRPFLYIDGEAYLKPSELKKELAKYEQVEIATFNISSIPILATKEEGFIRAVGCDLEKKYIRIDIFNPTDAPIQIYKNSNTYPKVKDAILLSLNRRPLYDVNCGESLTLDPGQNFTCVRAEGVFIAAGSRNQADTNATYDTSQPDKVFATRPGHQEYLDFFCRDSDQDSD